MRLKIIEEYLVFARYLNFSKAAAELHITQPNLSKHMAELERKVGVELIDRKTFGKNRPQLTKAGQFFAEEMAYLESNYQSTLEQCRAIGRAGRRDIRIQEIWQNNAMISLYALAGAFRGESLDGSVRYVRLTDKHPIEALLANEFDVVFDVWCGPYASHCEELAKNGVKEVALVTEPPCIWYQEGNPHLQDTETLTLEELLDIPVIITRGGTLDYMVYSYADYCNREGLMPRLRHLQPPDNSPTGMFMTDFQDGVLMTTPAMVQDPRLRSRPDLKYALIDDERVAVTFLVAARASDKEAVAFLNYVMLHNNS